MRKADYLLLARLFKASRTFSIDCENYHNEKFAVATGKDAERHHTQSKYYSGRLACINDLARSFASGASVTPVEFLRECGMTL